MTIEKFREEVEKLFKAIQYDSYEAVDNACEVLKKLYKQSPKNFVAEFVLMIYKTRSLECDCSLLKSSLQSAKSEAEYQRNLNNQLANAIDGLRVLMARFSAPKFKNDSKLKVNNGRIKLTDVLTPP